MPLSLLSAHDIALQAARLPRGPGVDWTVAADHLALELVFADFVQAFAFMAAVALEAERLNHHPDWSNTYNRVRVRLSTHEAGGLTLRDFELAARVSRHALRQRD